MLSILFVVFSLGLSRQCTTTALTTFNSFCCFHGKPVVVTADAYADAFQFFLLFSPAGLMMTTTGISLLSILFVVFKVFWQCQGKRDRGFQFFLLFSESREDCCACFRACRSFNSFCCFRSRRAVLVDGGGVGMLSILFVVFERGVRDATKAFVYAFNSFCCFRG